MASLTTALDTNFTPAVGDFIVQVTGAVPVELQRKNSSGIADAAYPPGEVLSPGTYIIKNPVAGAVYRFRMPSGANPAQSPVAADQ